MRFFKNYALSLILGAAFLISWSGQAVSGWMEFKAEQLEHHQPAHVLGDDGYIWQFLSATFENWESEFLQLLTFVILSTFFIHRNSPQSRDGDDEMQARLKRIESLLEGKPVKGKKSL